MEQIRFQINNVPSINDIVVGKIIEIDDIGSTVSITEYQGKKALLPISGYNHRKKLRLNQDVVVRITDVDSKENIIVDMRKMTHEENLEAIENHKQNKKLFSIISRIHYSLDIPLDKLVYEWYHKHNLDIEFFPDENREFVKELLADKKDKENVHIQFDAVSLIDFDYVKKLLYELREYGEVIYLSAPTYMIDLKDSNENISKVEEILKSNNNINITNIIISKHI